MADGVVFCCLPVSLYLCSWIAKGCHIVWHLPCLKLTQKHKKLKEPNCYEHGRRTDPGSPLGEPLSLSDE